MPNMMVLNPRRRRRKKMSAKQARYFGGGARRRRRSGRRSRAKVVVVSANPRKRRHRVRALARVVRRRYRRNPIGLNGFLANTLTPAAFGAAGAIAVDWLGGYVRPYLPASLNTPSMVPLTNIGLSLLAGWGVSMLAGSKRGGEAAAGGVIVALYNFASQQLYAPGGLLATSSTGQMGRYVMNGVQHMRSPRLRGTFGPGQFGPQIGNPLAVRSQLAGGPYAQTKFRMMRNGGASGRALGYVGPAPTLGRYMSR